MRQGHDLINMNHEYSTQTSIIITFTNISSYLHRDEVKVVLRHSPRRAPGPTGLTTMPSENSLLTPLSALTNLTMLPCMRSCGRISCATLRPVVQIAATGCN
ncbi:hypothetical protein GWK47_033111 [Chionoecetes opilio]|uniref:Uncharacterized protein n=1 Tax=Chionoecetes opilio TaxID=41210 RepID=A0A8J4YYB1_CHIOP|nr:hypothetical protein GWK47_033111 [Chionoecetes opilio]